jgi:hypothetical protein
VRRLCLILLLVALALPARAEATFPGFKTPSGNIGCGYFGAFQGQPASLRCDIRSGLKPQPRRACELDWTGLTVGPTGRARAVCAGDTAYDPRFHALAYGHSWSRGGIRCLSRRIGLRCANRGGHGFFLSRQRWRLF